MNKPSKQDILKSFHRALRESETVAAMSTAILHNVAIADVVAVVNEARHKLFDESKATDKADKATHAAADSNRKSIDKTKNLDKEKPGRAHWHKEVHEEKLNEFDAEINPKKKGMFKGKNVADLEKERSSLKKRAQSHQDQGEKVPADIKTKEHEVNYAIRAKRGWKGGV